MWSKFNGRKQKLKSHLRVIELSFSQRNRKSSSQSIPCQLQWATFFLHCCSISIFNLKRTKNEIWEIIANYHKAIKKKKCKAKGNESSAQLQTKCIFYSWRQKESIERIKKTTRNHIDYFNWPLITLPWYS